MKHLKTKLLKRILETAASRALRLAGVNGLVAGVASRLFWRFIVVPIVKHAHRKGRLGIRNHAIHIQKHNKVWHNLNYDTDSRYSPDLSSDR